MTEGPDGDTQNMYFFTQSKGARNAEISQEVLRAKEKSDVTAMYYISTKEGRGLPGSISAVLGLEGGLQLSAGLRFRGDAFDSALMSTRTVAAVVWKCARGAWCGEASV